VEPLEPVNEHRAVRVVQHVLADLNEARSAREQETVERLQAREQGLVVEDDESPDGEWQVSWKVEDTS